MEVSKPYLNRPTKKACSEKFFDGFLNTLFFVWKVSVVYFPSIPIVSRLVQSEGSIRAERLEYSASYTPVFGL